MLPRGIHAHLYTLAHATCLILINGSTPKELRKQLLKFSRKLKRLLPKEARREIEAAEAEATILAADHLRRES